MQRTDNRRVLIVDDNAAIHGDFKKILLATSADETALNAAESALFDEAPGATAPAATRPAFEVDSAFQGQEALQRVQAAVNDGVPYAVAFVDMRMPPGWDGVETIQALWQANTDLQVVVCTAFADYTWPQMIEKLGRTDRLLILKKPFDSIEVLQLATALTEKWNSLMRERQHVQDVMRAEQEARAYAASLETVNHALQTSWAKSEAESKQKSEFFAQVAGNVLAPIDALLERSINASDLAELEALGRCAAELAAPLRSVVDWSELEHGRARVERGVFSPSELVRASCERARARGKVAVELANVERLPDALIGDSRHLSRALEELLDHALRRATAGPIRVECSLRSQRSSSGELNFTVTDDGRPFSRDELARLFEPFSSPNATNLALALVKRIAHAVDGDVTCTSAPDSGTRFTLTAPVELAQVAI